MQKNTSVTLESHFEQFIRQEVQSGRYTLKKWGRKQRNRYLKKIDDAFHELS